MKIKDYVVRTHLYDIHKFYGAKFVNFAGYCMPLNYQSGSIQEHLYTRENASMFDVSHMGQISLVGPKASEYVETLVPSKIQNLRVDQLRYTMFLNDNGNVIDDIIVRKTAEGISLIVNAAQRDVDYNLLETNLPEGIDIDNGSNLSLIALQGPMSQKILENFDPSIKYLKFMNGCSIQIDKIKVYITRSGYTGEDGFEISLDNKNVDFLASKLLENNNVKLAGLGARDSLRLEAGLCLYGNELSTEINPIEANLRWIINPEKIDIENFTGSSSLVKEYREGADFIRVGIILKDRNLARKDAEIYSVDGYKIGRITSGGYSPTLKSSIAMGFIDSNFSEFGKNLHVKIRNKYLIGTITSLPFVKSKYVN